MSDGQEETTVNIDLNDQRVAAFKELARAVSLADDQSNDAFVIHLVQAIVESNIYIGDCQRWATLFQANIQAQQLQAVQEAQRQAQANAIARGLRLPGQH